MDILFYFVQFGEQDARNNYLKLLEFLDSCFIVSNVYHNS